MMNDGNDDVIVKVKLMAKVVGIMINNGDGNGGNGDGNDHHHI